MGYCEQLLFNKKIGLIFEIPSLFSDGKFWPNFNFLNNQPKLSTCACKAYLKQLFLKK